MKNPEEPDSIVELCKKTGLSSGTINYWARNKPGFKGQYRMAKKIMAKKNKRPAPVVNIKNRRTGWEDEFLEAYVLCNGRRKYAAEVVGIGHSTVEDRMNPKKGTYDEVFTERFKEAHALVNRSLVDVAYKRAIEDESDTMIKFLLSTTMPDEFGKTTTLKIDGKIEHSMVENRASEFLRGVFGEVIDAEYVEEKQIEAVRHAVETHKIEKEIRLIEAGIAQQEKRILEVVRANEGTPPGRLDGSEEIPLQERSVLSAEI